MNEESKKEDIEGGSGNNDSSNSPESEIPEEIDEVIKNLPESEQKTITRYIEREISVSRYHGPIPPPEELEKFDRIVPGSASKIFDQFIKQSDHRMNLEKKVIESQSRQSERGQHYGFIITILFLVASFILGLKGYGVVASILGGSTVIALATLFITGKKKQESELKEKNK